MRHPRSPVGVFALTVLTCIGGAPGAALAALCCMPETPSTVSAACPLHSATVPAATVREAAPPPRTCSMHQTDADNDAPPLPDCCLRMYGCADEAGNVAFASSEFLTPSMSIATPCCSAAIAVAVVPIRPQLAPPPLFPPPRTARS